MDSLLAIYLLLDAKGFRQQVLGFSFTGIIEKESTQK